MMKVTSCCGCCSLQKGSLIIGIFSLVSSVILFIVECILSAKIETIEDTNFRMSTYYIVKAFIAGMMTYTILGLILSILFVIGVVKRKTTYVFPMVCLCFSNLVEFIAVAIGELTYFFAIPGMPIGQIFLGFIILGGSFMFSAYIYLVIHNYYHELVAEKYGHTTDYGGKIFGKPLTNQV